MGQWISNNILLPIMYGIVDIGLLFGLILLVMLTVDKIREKLYE
jgi:putative effector of murein hydrolase LrgA (UPF0299 family)